MKFLVNMFNHNELGRRSLEDPITILGHMFQALGHEVAYFDKNEQWITPEIGYNVMVEGFTAPTVAAIAQLHSRGARFLLIGSEEPTPKGFNDGTQKEMVDRFHIFPQIAPYIEGILCLVPKAPDYSGVKWNAWRDQPWFKGNHVVDWYAQWAPKNPDGSPRVAYCELGYAPTLERIDPTVEPTFDFGFFGSLSPRRQQMLKRLKKASGKENNIVGCVNFPDQVTRDKIMRQAKVILQIRKFREMDLVSSSRINTAMHIGRPILAEPHKYNKPWDEIVRFSATERDFIHEALYYATFWKDLHREQYARFKAKMTPEFCIGDALRQVGFPSPKLMQQQQITVSSAKAA